MPNDLLTAVQECFPGLKQSDGTWEIDPARLLKFMGAVREMGFSYLLDLTAVDHGQHYTVVYQIYCYERPERITLKVNVPKEKPEIDSVTGIWGSADWMEREVYDMFGLIFTGHPNLKRILLEDDFVGFPLRKDFK